MDLYNERLFHIGDVVQHFKYETLTAKEQLENKYKYVIRGFAEHTESKEKLVIYQALYHPYKVYAKPMNMFLSEVDRNKYPDIKQEFRLKKVSEESTI